MKQNKASGFTLVELAISLMVIGLLLGGVLKGMEMIDNARIVKLGKQLTDYKMALQSFRNTYESFPGDMLDPGNRLQNCTASPCSDPGNEDSFIGDWPGATMGFNGISFTANSGLERQNFWRHLEAANMILPIPSERTDLYLMATPFSGVILYPTWLQIVTDTAAQQPLQGTFLVIKPFLSGTATNPATTPWGLPPTIAFQLDQKIDDGIANSGDLRAANQTAGAVGNCRTAGVYDVQVNATTCNLVYKIYDRP